MDRKETEPEKRPVGRPRTRPVEGRSNKGGKREGAGRKPTYEDAEQLNFKVEKQWLANLPIAKNAYAREALRRRLIKDGYLKEDL